MLKRSTALLVMLLLAAAVPLTAQREIRGRVTSSTAGAPLSGVNILVVGTSTGTLTDNNGNFTLRVPSGPARVRASLIGYKSEESVVPTGQQTVNFALQEDVLNLEGVVVTGQATTVARRNLANAVATVSAEQLSQAPSQSVEQALAGKIAGANISANSGAPGGGMQVDLRGVSSINAASEPLWVIDGVVVSNVAIPSNQNAVTGAASGSNPQLTQDAQVNRIADLNPDDIESIEVLKGASAAAIYGSQASNGVIIVTTKRGRAGAPQLSASQRIGYYRLSNKFGMRQWTRDEAVAAFGASAAQYFDASGSPRQSFDMEELLAGRQDLSSETSVSVRGGTEGGTRYYLSGQVQDDAGVIENTGFERQSVRLNLDQTFGDRVEAGVNLNLIHTLASRGLTNNDNTGTSFYMVFPFTPNFVDLRRQADGTYPANPFERSNPLQTAALMANDEDVWRFIAAGNVAVGLMEGETQSLNLRLNGGADYFAQNNSLFFPPELQFEPNDQEPGTSLLTNADNLNLTGNVSLVHLFSPAGAGWSATTSGGVQYSDQDLSIVRNVGRNLTAGQRNLDAATNIQVLQDRQRVETLGLYLQEELLMLDDRLLLTGSVRADRSSANGDTEKYFLYPKGAASYRIPGFLPRLDELKLRAAYGESGNQPLFGQKFTPLSATNNIQGAAGLVIPVENTQALAGDPDIEPERTREIEAGLDLTLFGSSATLELTVYRQNITNLLLQRTVAPSTGFATQFFNGGELRTEGLEAALAASPIRTAGFGWTTRATFYTNRSEIVELPVPSFRTGGFGTALGSFQIEEGRSATQIVGNNGVDANGSPIVETLGDATPDFRMSFSNDLTFGPLNLYGLLDWQQGGDIINLTKLLFDFGQNTADFPLPAGATARAVPQCNPDCYGAERIAGFGSYTQQYIEDGSYVKLREVSLSYNVPAPLLSRVGFGVERAQVVLSGRNLLTFTGYSGLDPEVSNFGNQQIARSIDVAPFPPSRSFWLAFNLGF